MEGEFELDLCIERQDLVLELACAIRAGEMTKERGVEILDFYTLYRQLEALGGEITAN